MKKISEAEAIASLKQKLDEATAKTALNSKEVEMIKQFPDMIKGLVKSVRENFLNLPKRLKDAIVNWMNRIVKRKNTKESVNEGLGSFLKTALSSLAKFTIKKLGEAFAASVFTFPVLTAIADTLRNGGGGPCLFMECGTHFLYFFDILKSALETIVQAIFTMGNTLNNISFLYDGAYVTTIGGGIATNPMLATAVTLAVFIIIGIALISYIMNINWHGGFIEKVWRWATYADENSNDVDDDGGEHYQYA